MKGDYYGDLAEFAASDTKSEAEEDARVAHTEATKITERVSVVIHSIRQNLGPNDAVFRSEFLQELDEACKMACVAFDVEAIQLVP